MRMTDAYAHTHRRTRARLPIRPRALCVYALRIHIRKLTRLRMQLCALLLLLLLFFRGTCADRLAHAGDQTCHRHADTMIIVAPSYYRSRRHRYQRRQRHCRCRCRRPLAQHVAEEDSQAPSSDGDD